MCITLTTVSTGTGVSKEALHEPKTGQSDIMDHITDHANTDHMCILKVHGKMELSMVLWHRK